VGEKEEMKMEPLRGSSEWIKELEEKLAIAEEKASKWDGLKKSTDSLYGRIAEQDSLIINLKIKLQDSEDKVEFYEETSMAKLMEYKEKASQLDALLKDVTVTEKCSYCSHKGIGQPLGCSDCHGKGTITRQATPEEMRELLDHIWRGGAISATGNRENRGWYFELKSGGVMRMESK
jgi:hypothetical protein